MADFKVQRGVSSIPVDTASVTITAGTDYTAPSAVTAAFIRIISSSHTGASTAGAGIAAARAGRTSCYISDAANLLTSITFTRGDATSTANAMRVSWEIIEYTGAASGANEFIVRTQNTETMSNVTTTATRSISGVVTAADVVVFLTSQGIDAAAGGTDWGDSHATSEYIEGSTSIKLTRGIAVYAYRATWAAVEFTGSNWTVQRISHTFAAVDTDETETVSDTGNLTRTFSHAQMRTTVGADTGTLNSYVAWSNSTTQASFRCTGSGVSGRTVVLWVVSNSQTTGTPMNVQRVSATRAAAASSPWNDTITAVSATDIAALMGVTSYSDNTTTQAQRGYCDINPTITATTTVENNRGRTAPLTTYRYEVVEFPTISAQSVVPVLLAHYRKRR